MQPDWNAFIAAYPTAVQATAAEARRLIFAVMPGVIEQVDLPSKITAYGYGRSYAGLICALMPAKGHVSLIFSRGVELADPGRLLIGKGKRARHVKLVSPADLDNPAYRDLLLQALALAVGPPTSSSLE